MHFRKDKSCIFTISKSKFNIMQNVPIEPKDRIKIIMRGSNNLPNGKVYEGIVLEVQEDYLILNEPDGNHRLLAFEDFYSSEHTDCPEDCGEGGCKGCKFYGTTEWSKGIMICTLLSKAEAINLGILEDENFQIVED